MTTCLLPLTNPRFQYEVIEKTLVYAKQLTRFGTNASLALDCDVSSLIWRPQRQTRIAACASVFFHCYRTANVSAQTATRAKLAVAATVCYFNLGCPFCSYIRTRTLAEAATRTYDRVSSQIIARVSNASPGGITGVGANRSSSIGIPVGTSLQRFARVWVYGMAVSGIGPFPACPVTLARSSTHGMNASIPLAARGIAIITAIANLGTKLIDFGLVTSNTFRGRCN